ncbi:MAG: DUF1361 domain-containing protein [Flavobacteriia bacterium]|nr:DUF1361 domain-containing protein [Flavobacteriia bacterium]
MKTNQKQNILIGITTVFCFLLLIARFYISNSFNYSFLIWNLILAWIPLIISRYLARKHEFISINNRLILLFSWLVFFPNAPYILTDLFHLSPKMGVPLWFDLILIISFAWNGLLIGFLSLLEIHQLLNYYFINSVTWFFVSFMMILSGFGIYLGRFERWNSWDIATHPFVFMKRIFFSLTNIELLPRILGVTFVFGIFLIVSYLTIYFLTQKHETEQ